MKFIRTFIILVHLITGFFFVITDVNAERPKIGLVLGGGGARGAAHVGVLKILEENNVPIDYIVGTSMGSIVGGLYASGMSPQEIEDKINAIDWVDIFNDRPSEKYMSFRDKQNQTQLTSIELGIKDGEIKLPRGVKAGQKLGFELKELTLPVAHINDFDKFSIPFRAVATDLRTGEVVVHKEGSLPDAIRSSMSIPGAFPPVEIDGRILIDGFLVNNVPIDVAKAMGADVIIAVNVGMSPEMNKDLESLLAVTNQMIAILSEQNVEQSLALLTEKDLLIEPDLGDLTTTSFTELAQAIQAGEKSSKNVESELARYSVSDGEYDKYLEQQRYSKKVRPVIDYIQVQGATRTHEKAILGRIKTKTGAPLDLNLLQQDLTRIYAMGDFETVDFKIAEEDGKTGLIITPKDKPWGPNYLRFGLNMSSNFSEDSQYNVLLDYRMTQLNKLGGEWKNVLELGENRGITTEWYQPLDIQEHFFIQPFVEWKRELNDVYDGDDRIAEYEKTYLRGGLGGGINLSSYAQLRAEYIAGTTDAEPNVGGSNLPEFDDVREGAIRISLDYDQLDNHKFPKRGIVYESQFYFSDDSLGGDYSYEKMEASLMKATTFARKHTLLTKATIGYSPDEESPFFDKFSLGGFMNLSGYGERQLRGQHKGLAQALYYYKFTDDRFGSGGFVYLGAGVEYGNVWNDTSDMEFSDGLVSGLVFLGIDSPLGPLYIGYAKGESTDHGRLYFYLGKTF